MMKRLLALPLMWVLLFAGTPVLLSGCAALVAGGGAAGAVAYVRGELRSEVECSYQQCREATDRAVDQLELTKIDRRTDGMTTRYELEDADDKSVNIRVAKKTDNITDVRIRVGTFGDETKSRHILRAIEDNIR
ncbi:uncharacterized protein DUF3568 [Alkalispirillum mobile]|uniref:Uncharacterized protein DUF3568 n=2 Tax=Alkalispirillum mobile TaxID=85925 RepID=A0A498BR04_9GAMM|nr:uncharacterized protein DUF3568 [Alkalispirillum mobile]